MKAVSDLSHEDLVDIVEQLQAWLYLDEVEVETDDGKGEFVQEWNPDKEWPLEVCEFMAGRLSDLGLVPEFLGDEPKLESPSCDICGGDH